MSDIPTPETDAYITSQSYSPTEHQWRCFARKLERERDEARRERDEAGVELELAEAKVLIMEDSLKWIAGRYCHEKTTAHLALVAYEMSSEARWTIQEMQQKEEAK